MTRIASVLSSGATNSEWRVINQLRTSILIDSHFLMMFGGSNDQRLPRVEDNPQTLKPQAAAEVVTAVPILAVHVSPEALEHQIELQQAASGDHPLFHPEQTTLKVKVLQKRLDELFKEARWSSRDLGKPNLLSFATHKGNQIALELLNQTEEPVAVVVQIDGINQIGRNVAEPTQSCYWSVQPRGNSPWTSGWIGPTSNLRMNLILWLEVDCLCPLLRNQWPDAKGHRPARRDPDRGLWDEDGAPRQPQHHSGQPAGNEGNARTDIERVRSGPKSNH